MWSLKSVLLCIVITLLHSESAIKLAMAFLLSAHVTINVIYDLALYHFNKYLPLILTHLPYWIDHLITAARAYYEQAIVFARPVLLKGAIILTNYTETVVRNAPCGLCKVGTSVIAGVGATVGWMAGGAQVLMEEQWDVIKKEVAAYCAKAGGCA